MFVSRVVVLIAATLATSAASTGAQSANAARHERLGGGLRTDNHELRPTATASLTSAHIRIDGKLTEDDWQRAAPVTRFVQVEPSAGRAPTEQTEVRFLVGKEALFIGARMFDSHAAAIRRRLSRRDDDVLSDRLTVSLDAFHNHRTAVRFSVSASGSIADATVGARLIADASWDPVWESATTMDEGGWTAELRIPLSQFRYAAGVDVWGVQIERYLLRMQERDAFAFASPNERSIVENYGHLSGVGQLVAGNHVEILPYLSERASFLSAPSTSALSSSQEHRVRAGADVRYAVSSSLTLNASVNPDFGQVEVDPSVVNLTVFETLFPEKRPFFVEGNEFFEFGRMRAYNLHPFPQAFFSRRIGRAPQLAPPNIGAANAIVSPDQSDILVATKLTGRSGSGWSLGALHALTREARARALLSDGTVTSGVAEPMTSFAVVRSTRDFAAGRTTLGLVATSVDRNLNDSSARVLRSSARVAGIDVRHAWGNRAWALDGDFSLSAVHGSTSAITMTQRSSAHYLQRPDRSDAHFDSTRRSLSGFAGEVALTKLRGSWVGNIAYQDVSPGFEVNDLGREQSAGRHLLSTDLHYQNFTPGRFLNNYIIWPFTNHQWNYDGEPLPNVGLPTYNFWVQGQLRNFWNFVLWTGYSPRFVDDQLTRGGPAGSSRLGGLRHVELKSNQGKALAASVLGEFETREGGGRRTTIGGGAAWRPVPNALFRVDPALSTQRDPSQFVRRIGPTASMTAPVGGALFGQLDRRTLSIDARAEWTFSPKLTLQAYVQPFYDRGQFRAFKQLRTPRTLDYEQFGRDVGTVTRTGDEVLIDPDATGPATEFSIADPDYSIRSFRGNAVLRWEYRPGSTLFVVWQQQPGGQGGYRDLQFRRDPTDDRWLPADNVLLLKGTYWLSF
jgi:hypothetical protein